MATIVKTDSGSWKAIIRGVYISRSHSEKTSIESALARYLKEITPTKKPSTQTRN